MVSFSPAAFDAFLSGDDDSAIVMLNLLRFVPDGGSNGGRITVASGARKFDVDVDWLTGRVAILD